MCAMASTSPRKRRTATKTTTSSTAPSTGPGLARARPATVVAPFAVGVVPLGDVGEDPHEGPPRSAPPPPLSPGVVVHRWIAVAVIGGGAILALALEEQRPTMVVVGGPARVVTLLRRQLAPVMITDGGLARHPHWHRRDQKVARAEHPSRWTAHVRRDDVSRRPLRARLGDEKPTSSVAFLFVVVHGEGVGAGEDGGVRRFWRRWRRALAGMWGEKVARGV
jgi:hypothetical protein